MPYLSLCFFRFVGGNKSRRVSTNRSKISVVLFSNFKINTFLVPATGYIILLFFIVLRANFSGDSLVFRFNCKDLIRLRSRRFHSIFLDILGVLHLADCVLFFGCRNSKKDFFFRDQWCPLVESGSLKLFTAFSRDQVHITLVYCFFKRSGTYHT